MLRIVQDLDFGVGPGESVDPERHGALADLGVCGRIGVAPGLVELDDWWPMGPAIRPRLTEERLLLGGVGYKSSNGVVTTLRRRATEHDLSDSAENGSAER
jgi:hypothetical protein